jgi:hypothetical protein
MEKIVGYSFKLFKTNTTIIGEGVREEECFNK